MPAADVIQPSASTASVGKSLRYVQKWAYGYSGQVACDNNATTLLEFTTSATVFSGWFFPMYMTGALQARDYSWVVKFNGEIVIIRTFSQSYGPAPEREIKILIPPVTNVLITAANLTDTESHNMAAKLVGRVYGAE